jgi:hypothetical protein
MEELTQCRFCQKEVGYEIKTCSHCGKNDPLGIEDEIRELISSGQRIEAVRKVVELTKVGLKVSKDYVDSLQ